MFTINWHKKNFTSKEIFQNELEQFFSPSSFIGLKPMLNNTPYYITDFLSRRYIVTKTDKYNLLNNTCLHKNARLACNENDFKNNKLVCPVHYWSYDLDGKLLSAPCSNFDCAAHNLSVRSSSEIFEHELFLLTNKQLAAELTTSKFLKNFDFSRFELLEISCYEQKGNWKEYGIVFNDSNHVKFFHPEMSDVLEKSGIDWEFGENYVAHRLKFNPGWMSKLNNRFTKYFSELKTRYTNISYDGVSDYAVTWFNIFPNVFIDFWAKQINIVYIEPLTLDSYKLHNFWLCDRDLMKEAKTNQLFVDAMNDVENEDNNIILRIHEGMLSNYETDIFTEYVVSPLESGDVYFNKWLMKNGNFYIR